MARELSGQTFDPHSADPTNQVLKDAMWHGSYPLVQAAFYAEHRARLAILKTAIDHECAVACGKLTAPETEEGDPIIGTEAGMKFWMLPETFRLGLQTLKEQPYFRRYALFWQVFMWGFGGFWLLDRQDEEFAALSAETGIPPDHISNAMTAYDELFPTPRGWLASWNTTQARRVKMMSYALHGVGALWRREHYGVKEYGELKHKDYTTSNLAGWHNGLVDFLATP